MATSADTVTMRSPAGVRPSAASARPNASCVESGPAWVSPSVRRDLPAWLAARRARKKGGGSAAISAASGASRGNRAHSSPAAHAQRGPERLDLGAVSSAPWFSGSPASGRPHPLTRVGEDHRGPRRDARVRLV